MKRLIAALAVAGIALMGALSPLSATAAMPTTVEFSTPETTAAFASDWMIELSVAAPNTGYLVTEGAGRIDITLDEIPGVFASLDVFAGGRAFLSQPVDRPLLAAGTYTVRAAFVPAGSALSPATAAAPATLVITPLALEANVEASVSGDLLQATATLGGAYVEETGRAPAGVWTLSLVRSGEDEVLEEHARAQAESELDPIVVDFTSSLAAGTDYEVRWTFVPVDELVGGLEFTGEGSATVSTPVASPFAFVGAPVEAPLALWVSLAVLVVLLVGGAIALIVLVRKRSPRAAVEAGPVEGAESVDVVPIESAEQLEELLRVEADDAPRSDDRA